MLLGFALVNAACGYKVRSSVGSLPEGIGSLGIPTFQNHTDKFKVEQVITGAIMKEFNARTRVLVLSQKSGVDALLLGEVQSVQYTPVTFGSQSFGSAYTITVWLRVRLMRLTDSKILWQKSNFKFHERYTMNSDVRDFFSEENPALERMAEDIAASLVSAILESQPIDSPKP